MIRHYVRRHVPSNTSQIVEYTGGPITDKQFLTLLLRWSNQQPGVWLYHEALCL